ncbi:hypothetical protein BBP00_00001349 [Phytophthora kernoviae]|uniref:Uncharacterized protein n=1 Tax=Phytophthora kernoviae TaxID=325452 RepID=A0A3F2S211_9STRA|nr:hypothetical protein BBP00_00001349 [Phytophthora kernoviae]
MNGAWFALLNAALFVAQVVVYIVYAKSIAIMTRDYETLITPANYAAIVWTVIYALVAVFVCVDVFAPRLSLFADSNKPAQLRLCFAATCVLDIFWMFMFVWGHAYAATVVIYGLWLALLVLYIYAVNDRNARSTERFDWGVYLCNELPLSMYFAWITTMAFTQLAMAMQHSNHDYLRLTTYLSLLSVVIVVALLTARYAQDMVCGLVVIWYLVAVSTKHMQFPSSIQYADIAVRACAGEGAAIITVMLAIGLCEVLMDDGNSTAILHGSFDSALLYLETESVIANETASA